MTAKQSTLLEEAREHCRSWRVLEAYNIFRRYFDRLPFSPEKEHAEYIGWFVRTLFELGKDFELKFYLSELEKLYQKRKDPHIAYTLGFIYSFSGPEKMEASRQIFESIVRDSQATNYHAKSKMMLADYYLRKDDLFSCRTAIESIGPVEDPQLSPLIEIWRAVILRRESKLQEAKDIVVRVILSIDCKREWRIILAHSSDCGSLVARSIDARRSIFADVSIVQINRSGFITSKDGEASPIIPAVNSALFFIEIVIFSTAISCSTFFLKRTCFRFKMISVTSSVIPFKVANS